LAREHTKLAWSGVDRAEKIESFSLNFAVNVQQHEGVAQRQAPLYAVQPCSDRPMRVLQHGLLCIV